MNKKKILIIVFIFTLSGIVSSEVFAFGVHESYTCPAYRTTDCKLTDPPIEDDPINQTCADQGQHPDYDITIWGDSLTELVSFYGLRTPSFFGLPSDAGVYGGNPDLMDSWSDYLTAFGEAYQDPFRVQEFGWSGHTSESLKNRVLGLPDGYEHRCYPEYRTGFFNPTEHASKTSARSVVMIGGNDNLGQRFMVLPVLPFLIPHVNKYIMYNISEFIDWNLENGKSVLLEGNIPSRVTCNSWKPNQSGCIYGYDSYLINRESLCAGGGPLSQIGPPPEIPWWVLVLFPGAAEVLVDAYVNQLKYIINAWMDFNHKIMKKEPEFAMEAILSIAQACLNDRLGRELMPEYSNAGYGNRVFYYPMYDYLNRKPSDIYADNFWEPKSTAYENGDMIHVGALGYEIWAKELSRILVNIGWNKAGGGKPAVDTVTVQPPPDPGTGGGTDPCWPCCQNDWACWWLVCIWTGYCDPLH